MTATGSTPARRTSRRPLRRQLQARFMRVVNVPMRVVLGLPFASPLTGRLMLITFTGRRTGKTYRQPLSYVVEHDGALLTPGGGKWKLKLSPGKPVRMRLRGRDVLARLEFIDDLAAVERLLKVMIAANSRIRSFVVVPLGADGQFDRDRLQTGPRYGFRVVRWHLQPPD